MKKYLVRYYLGDSYFQEAIEAESFSLDGDWLKLYKKGVVIALYKNASFRLE